ncbi:MAG: hypothetical protein ACKOWX_10140 [Flavobacteriales bacterium]
MQATKRLAFLLVLLAFLGNLALGMSLPVVSKYSDRASKENNKQLHLSHKVKASAYFLTLDETEEIEETEADSNFESTPNAEHFCSVYSTFLTTLLSQICQAPQKANEPGAFRAWLWAEQEILIHYQVFRI